MSFRINPGPLDSSVLFYGQEHRSCHVFHGSVDENPMYVRRGDQRLWQYLRDHNIDPRVKHILDTGGFGGVIDVGYRIIDHALIHAMVERWRPETHTFHLTVGEATVTLQDVNVLWGLPIEGSPVTGTEIVETKNALIQKVNVFLGFTPLENEIVGGSIRTTTLMSQLAIELPQNAAGLQILQRARLVALLLCGGTLFPDSSNDRIPLHFLNQLEDLSGHARISWGSGVLACLYRNLCKASNYTAVEISGPVYLLQLWVWERFKNLSPAIKNDMFDYSTPIGARWRVQVTNSQNTRHVLRAYRSQLQSMRDIHFNWTPYDRDLWRLPQICVSGRDSWRCECWLICWEVVEFYLPGRVLRQFNIVQGIPPPVPCNEDVHRKLHKKMRTGRRTKDKNWAIEHLMYVESWNHRHQNIVGGEPISSRSVTNGYISWYNSISLRYISDPTTVNENQYGVQDDGGANQFLVDSMSQVYQESQQSIGAYPELANRFTQFGGTIQQLMGLAHYEYRLELPTHLTTEPVPLGGNEYAPQSVRRRGNRRGRGRGRQLMDLDNQTEFDLNQEENLITAVSSSFPDSYPNVEQPGLLSQHLVSQNFEQGAMSTPHLVSPDVQQAAPSTPHLVSPNVQQSAISNPHLTSPNVQFGPMANYHQAGFTSPGYVPVYNQSPTEFGGPSRYDDTFVTPPPNTQEYDSLSIFGFNIFGDNPSSVEQNRFSEMTPIQMSYGRPEREHHPVRCGTSDHLVWLPNHPRPPPPH